MVVSLEPAAHELAQQPVLDRQVGQALVAVLGREPGMELVGVEGVGFVLALARNNLDDATAGPAGEGVSVAMGLVGPRITVDLDPFFMRDLSEGIVGNQVLAGCGDPSEDLAAGSKEGADVGVRDHGRMLACRSRRQSAAFDRPSVADLPRLPWASTTGTSLPACTKAASARVSFMKATPEPELRAWAEAVGGPAVWTWCGWEHAESRVWRLEGRSTAYCKVHRQGRKYAQERLALERWAPGLRGAPRLLAARDMQPRALLLTEVAGTLVEARVGLPVTASELYRQAGAWLAALHGLAHVDRDPLVLAQALCRRAGCWLERAQGLVDAGELRTVAAATAIFADLEGVSRVPCHRDYSPRNWLIDEAGNFGVIDFEHARPDWWLYDCDRLAGDWWLGREDLRTAFFAGYGRQPTAIEREVAEVVAAVNAVSSVVWATEHDDGRFLALGRQRLARWLAAD